MSNAGREDLAEKDTNSSYTAVDIHKALEKLENKKDRQRYMSDVIERIGLADTTLDTLLLVSECAFAGKLYLEFIKATKKALELTGEARRVHVLLDGLLHSGKQHSLRKMPKESLIDVAGLYVEIADIHRRNHCLMEMYQSLESFSEIVSATKTFPERRCTVAYFRFLSEVFLSRNMFFSFLNALARLVMLNPHFTSQLSADEFAEFVERTFALASFKNEGAVFQKLFGGLAMLPVKEARAIIDRDLVYEQPATEWEGKALSALESDYVMWLGLDRNWDAVLSRQRVELAGDKVSLLAFLRKNNIEFTIECGYILIAGYRYRSMTREVFLLKERFSRQLHEVTNEDKAAREKAFGKFLEQKRMYGRGAENKEAERKKVVVAAKKDYFTKNHNLFRLYLREYAGQLKTQPDADGDYEKRKKSYDDSFGVFSQRERSVFDKLMSIRDSVLEAVQALDEKVERASQEQRRLAAEADERERQMKMQEESWRRPSGAAESALEAAAKPGTLTRAASAARTDVASEGTYVPPVLNLSALTLASHEERERGAQALATPKSASPASNKENRGIYQPPIVYGARGWERAEKTDGARKPFHTRQKPGEDADSKKHDSTSWRT